MTADLTFGIIFIVIILYSLIRPFNSIFSKLLLILGSSLGLLSVVNLNAIDSISRSLGVERGADLFLYLGIITALIFILFLADRFNATEKKIDKLAKYISIREGDISKEMSSQDFKK